MSDTPGSDRSTSIANRYRKLRAEVPAHVTIVAVGKTQPAEAIAEVVRAGCGDVGENYVQEARAKFSAIEATAFTKHFIGHVQRNKAKAIAQTFDLVQSVDRLEAGIALARAAEALQKTLRVLIQVNISPQERFGAQPREAPALARQLASEPNLLVEGVMAIGPLGATTAQTLRAFENAAEIFREIGGPTLSLGMSADWQIAVEAGSTMVRLGSAIFGARPAPARVED